jgi:hypothetical protein
MGRFHLKGWDRLIISRALYLNDSLYPSNNTIKLSNSKLTGIIIMKEATYRPKRAV